MHRLIASSCLHIINHFHSLEPPETAENGEGGGGPHWDGPPSPGLLTAGVQVFPAPRNQTIPWSLTPLAWPMLSHSLLPSPKKLLEGMVYSTEPPALLSLSLLNSFHLPRPSHTTCPRPTPHGSLAHAWSQPPSLSTQLHKSEDGTFSPYLLLHQPSILDTPNPLILPPKHTSNSSAPHHSHPSPGGPTPCTLPGSLQSWPTLQPEGHSVPKIMVSCCPTPSPPLRGDFPDPSTLLSGKRPKSLSYLQGPVQVTWTLASLQAPALPLLCSFECTMPPLAYKRCPQVSLLEHSPTSVPPVQPQRAMPEPWPGSVLSRKLAYFHWHLQLSSESCLRVSDSLTPATVL